MEQCAGSEAVLTAGGWMRAVFLQWQTQADGVDRHRLSGLGQWLKNRPLSLAREQSEWASMGTDAAQCELSGRWVVVLW